MRVGLRCCQLDWDESDEMYWVHGVKIARVLWSLIAELWRTLVEWCFWGMQDDGSDLRKANTEAALVSRTRLYA